MKAFLIKMRKNVSKEMYKDLRLNFYLYKSYKKAKV